MLKINLKIFVYFHAGTQKLLFKPVYESADELALLLLADLHFTFSLRILHVLS